MKEPTLTCLPDFIENHPLTDSRKAFMLGTWAIKIAEDGHQSSLEKSSANCAARNSFGAGRRADGLSRMSCSTGDDTATTAVAPMPKCLGRQRGLLTDCEPEGSANHPVKYAARRAN